MCCYCNGLLVEEDCDAGRIAGNHPAASGLEGRSFTGSAPLHGVLPCAARVPAGESIVQKKTRITLLAAAALAFPVAASAQETPAPQPAPAQPAPAAPAQDELTQIQQRLGALQQQAMQDPAIKAASEALSAEVQAAMARLDPAAAEKAARAQALQADVAAARAAADNAKLNQLATEARELQAYFAQLQPRALALPEIQEKRKAFTELLFAKMTEIDPQAQALVTRLNELRGTASQR